MSTPTTTRQSDEIIAFVVFILCCIISFFSKTNHVEELPFTILNGAVGLMAGLPVMPSINSSWFVGNGLVVFYEKIFL